MGEWQWQCLIETLRGACPSELWTWVCMSAYLNQEQIPINWSDRRTWFRTPLWWQHIASMPLSRSKFSSNDSTSSTQTPLFIATLQHCRPWPASPTTWYVAPWRFSISSQVHDEHAGAAAERGSMPQGVLREESVKFLQELGGSMWARGFTVGQGEMLAVHSVVRRGFDSQTR